MNQVEINVLELELAETGTARLFNIAVIVMPQLGRDKELFARNTSLDALLKSLTNFLFISVKLGSVNVSVAVLKDGLLDDLLWVLIVQEGAQAYDRDLVTTVQCETRASLWLDYLLLSLNHNVDL